MSKSENCTASFTVDQTPEEVFKAINNVRDGGRKISKAVPTNSALSLRTATKMSIFAG